MTGIVHPRPKGGYIMKLFRMFLVLLALSLTFAGAALARM